MALPAKALSTLPAGLRTPLLTEYEKVCRNYAEGRWDASELKAGRFCEIVYTIIDGQLSGTFNKKPKKPDDFPGACKALEKYPKDTSIHSFRITIPRLLPGLYDIRNNRNVGHVGGDVDPSHMDATAALAVCQWVMAELVRVFHDLTPTEAQQTADILVERKTPLVWEVDGVKRVLIDGLKSGDQCLLLLYQHGEPVTSTTIVTWIEHTNASVFRRDVLRPMHKKKLVHFNEETDRVTLSPVGSKYVEEKLLKH